MAKAPRTKTKDQSFEVLKSHFIDLINAMPANSRASASAQIIAIAAEFGIEEDLFGDRRSAAWRAANPTLSAPITKRFRTTILTRAELARIHVLYRTSGNEWYASWEEAAKLAGRSVQSLRVLLYKNHGLVSFNVVVDRMEDVLTLSLPHIVEAAKQLGTTPLKMIKPAGSSY